MQAERRQSEPETGARLSMRTPMHGDAQPAGDIRARLAAMQPSSSAPFGQQQERLQELLQAQQYVPPGIKRARLHMAMTRPSQSLAPSPL